MYSTYAYSALSCHGTNWIAVASIFFPELHNHLEQLVLCPVGVGVRGLPIPLETVLILFSVLIPSCFKGSSCFPTWWQGQRVPTWLTGAGEEQWIWGNCQRPLKPIFNKDLSSVKSSCEGPRGRAGPACLCLCLLQRWDLPRGQLWVQEHLH